MARGSSASYRARRLQRERKHRQRQVGATESPAPRVSSVGPPGETTAARAVTVPCAWCGGRITPGARGLIPTWCSATCGIARGEARAASSGRSAVGVLERRIEVPSSTRPSGADVPESVAGRVVLLSVDAAGGELHARDRRVLRLAQQQGDGGRCGQGSGTSGSADSVATVHQLGGSEQQLRIQRGYPRIGSTGKTPEGLLDEVNGCLRGKGLGAEVVERLGVAVDLGLGVDEEDAGLVL